MKRKFKNTEPKDSDLSDTPFIADLKRKFDEETALKVIEAFQKMSQPLPQKIGEALSVTEGYVVFLNRYGVTIRIEYKDSVVSRSKHHFDKIDDSPWAQRYLGSVNAGKAQVEIFAGCRKGWSSMDVEQLSDDLKQQGIRFWDSGTCNYGFIPVRKMPHFPAGVPVVIDRCSMERLSESTEYARKALLMMSERAREAEAIQEELYGPVREIFEQAWALNSPQLMEKFWQMCEELTKEGKFVTGWNDGPWGGAPAKAYAERLPIR